jgi:lambda repressor-like predicted transcriptional regulator
MQPDQQNTVFTLATDLVNKTNQHIFLTGKAGTGKTTFLKHIKEHTIKNTVVVAPTGVAAINAGGVTMHSFFQLPFGPYIPQSFSGNKFSGDHNSVSDKNSLFKNIRFNKDKINLLNELQLLIIDEISMVRCDMLDAIDAILRHFRRNYHVPFGGVQVLYIGDMYQLPPVMPDEEWRILNSFYESPFFFSAKAIEQASPLYVELKKIYRQNEELFINILNRIRNNHTTNDDLEILNDLYEPSSNYKREDGANTILLTTHNRKADDINQKELYKLTSIGHKFKGIIEGDFNDKLLPNDAELELKEGAQIMFIKNDSSPEKKYFNGKLATIKKIAKEKIFVAFENDAVEHELRRETWKNIRYQLSEDNQIKEEELGSFTQYPIRLAWAITIHKSQGLTFERAIIDAGQSFAAGQVYVALSRCTSLDGVTLHSKIERQAISTDERIVAFAKKESQTDELERVLALEKEEYMANLLLNQFNFNKLVVTTESFKSLVPQKKLPNQEKALAISEAMHSKATEQQNYALKFQTELKQLLAKVQTDKESLVNRTHKAVHYFTTQIAEHILHPFQEHIKELATAAKVRQYITALKRYELEMWAVLCKINQSSYDDVLFNQSKANIEKYNPEAYVPVRQKKEDTIPTADISFNLFREGKTIREIATERGLADSTIEGHLAQKVRTGEVQINELVPVEKIKPILEAIAQIGSIAFKPILELLGDGYTYGQVRAVSNYNEWLKENEATKASS